MRITQVMTDLRPAGAERVVADLSIELSRRGHQVEVVGVLPAPARSPVLEALGAAGIPVRSLDLTAKTPWRYRRLGPMLDRFLPDLVHAHLFHAGLAARMTRAGRRAPLVETVHCVDRRPGRFWQFLLERGTAGRVDRFTAVSLAVRDYHARRIGVDPGRFRVIPNGLRPPRRPEMDEIAGWKREWGAEPGETVLGSVGRLNRQKGYDRLLRALPALASRVPSGRRWTLVLIGDGPERRALERRAERAPERIRVVFPGFLPDAAARIAAFDLFFMPSRYEGFGLALAEAMAAGVPAVVSSVDSLPEVASRHAAAQLVDFDDPAAVAEAAAALLAPGVPHEPRHPFSLDVMVEAYLNLYRELVGSVR